MSYYIIYNLYFIQITAFSISKGLIRCVLFVYFSILNLSKWVINTAEIGSNSSSSSLEEAVVDTEGKEVVGTEVVEVVATSQTSAKTYTVVNANFCRSGYSN